MTSHFIVLFKWQRAHNLRKIQNPKLQITINTFVGIYLNSFKIIYKIFEASYNTRFAWNFTPMQTAAVQCSRCLQNSLFYLNFFQSWILTTIGNWTVLSHTFIYQVNTVYMNSHECGIKGKQQYSFNPIGCGDFLCSNTMITTFVYEIPRALIYVLFYINLAHQRFDWSINGMNFIIKTEKMENILW